MARTRTFIAVAISEDIRASTVALQKELAKTGSTVKWVEAENLHVSLLFLGEVDDRELHAVCKAVREVAAGEPPFALRVSGVGAFPNARRPKVVWAGVTEGAEELQRLYLALEEKLLDLGCYRKEERGYTPHLTLGRVKDAEDGFALATELTKRMNWTGGRTMVEEVLIFSSGLQRDGPVYTVLGRAALGGK
ncbi:MAG: RNA 2',3'-cyclic phosphodiesterase [Planctomycetia bacterium]|nr:RNA 2',3'-cyclic phosphodiesterase [Planctomycetia bacterium]